MFISGTEFGIGFCCGTIVIPAAVIAVICLFDKAGHLFGKRKPSPQPEDNSGGRLLRPASPHVVF